jgi:aminoglycoside 3-N-acetyltransferase
MNEIHTVASLRSDLERLGLASGDVVMVHAAVSRIGTVFGGPDAVIAALRDTVGADGTIMAYLDWDAPWEDFLDEAGRVLPEWRAHVLPFDPWSTRAARSNGVLPEFLRTTPGSFRSGNPGASVAAIGAEAAWLTADHPLDYGYGPGSPFEKVVDVEGKVLMLGAPLDTMTLMHHAEHLARLPDKRVVRKETPFATLTFEGIEWRMIDEFDTAEPVVEALPQNFIEHIVTAYLGTGQGAQGRVGNAHSVLVDAADIVSFGIAWLERHAG